MNTRAIQWMFRMPSCFGAGMRASRIGFIGFLVAFILSGPFAAEAQQAPPVPAELVQELEDLARVMEDKAAREQLLSRIRALIATRKNSQLEAPVEGVGARLIGVLSENVKETSRQLVAAVNALRNVPQLIAAVRDQVANPKSRQRWFDLIIKLAAIVFIGWVAERLVRLLLRRPRRALEERDADTIWVRLPLLAGRTVLDLVPIAAFAAAGYAVAPVVRPTPQVHIMALTLINATAAEGLDLRPLHRMVVDYLRVKLLNLKLVVSQLMQNARRCNKKSMRPNRLLPTPKR